MNDKKVKKFINDYETKIKKLRDRYYEKVNSKEFKDTTFTPNYNAISITITLIVCTLMLVFFHGIIGDIITLIIATLSTIITRFIIKEDDNLQNNDFIRAIRKCGYLSIEAYDEKLKEYVTGPCGVYKKELEDLKDIYNINQETDVLYAQNNDRYFAWRNKEKNTINFLNTKITEKPEVISFHQDRVRYYRFDKTQKLVILKTDTEDYYFLPRSLEEIEELFPGKDFHSSKSYEPEEYINDFENYIEKVKKEIESKEKSCSKKKLIARNSAIAIATIMLTCIIIESLIPKLMVATIIIPIISLIPYTFNLSRFFREYFRIPKNEYEIIKTINNDRKNINRFNELKVSLAIDNTSQVVYTKEGTQYLTWVRNGYFHLFQNMINYDVVYLVVKIDDVEYFKPEETACTVKLKNKKIIFKPCAAEIFENIIPEKNYNIEKNLKK